MRIVIAGGNGYIGRNLTRRLTDAGHHVVWLSHRPGLAAVAGDFAPVYEVVFEPHEADDTWAEELAECDAVVNLSGSPIAARWNPRVKHILRESRLETGRAIVNRLADLASNARPPVFVSASGIGYYGDRGDDLLEESQPPGDNWLSALAFDWEAEAYKAEKLGVRVVTVRTGAVLGTEGLVPQMSLPFKLFVGGPIGSGEQFISTIHIDDIVSVYVHAIENGQVAGALNGSAEPMRMRDFAKAMGHALHRPSWFPVPRFALRLVLGEVADYTLMSQRADLSKLESTGFEWKYRDVPNALNALLRR